MAKIIPGAPTKFVREYFSPHPETGKQVLESRWHFDLKKFPFGPILVEEFNLPTKEKKKKKKVAKE